MTLSSLLPCEQIYPLAPPTLLSLHNRRRIKTEVKAKVVTAVWETDLIQFLAALDVFHKDDFKDRMNKIKATWRNGCFEKKDDHPVGTQPTKPPPNQNGCSPKYICSNHLCCHMVSAAFKYSMSPK